MKKSIVIVLLSVLLASAMIFSVAMAEDTVLQFWTFSEFSSGALIEKTNIAIKEFETEHPGVTVQVTGMGDDELLMSLTTAAMADNMPDLFVTNAYDGAAIANFGGIANIYDKWYAEPADWRSQFNEEVVALYEPEDGVLYSMPYTGWAEILYRNLTVLEKAGIDPNVPIKDWNDFISQCKQIYEKTGAYCTFNNTLSFNDYMAWYAGAATPEEASVDFENLKSNYSPEKLAETTQFLKAIEPYVSSVGPSDQASKDLFVGNEMAYYVDGPWTDISFRESDVNYDYALIPGSTENNHGGRSGYELMAVGTTKNQDLAYELGKKLVDKDSMLRWAEVDQRFFANNIAAQAAIDSGSAIMKAVMDARQYSIPVQLPYFKEPYPADFFSPVMEYVNDAFEGNVDYLKGAQEAVDAMDEILEEEYGY